MNHITLIGRLTKDPELKFAPGSGNAVTNFTMAVDRRFSKEKEVDFIPVVVWGKQAEATANYMTKGKLIAVGGRLQIRNYDAKDGAKRYITEVIAEDVQFLEWGNGDKPENRVPKTDNDGNIPVTECTDSEIPF